MTTENAPHPSRPGLFVALDGPDGGGKTTQAETLARSFRAQGREVVTCRDPGGTDLGDRLRATLLGRDGPDRGLRAEMLLYMASRAQLVDTVIRPAIEAGRVVVTDRFLLSNLVYQGFAGGLGVEPVGRVGLVATGGILPDLTVVLDVPLSVGKGRTGPARDRIEDRPDDYHERVRSGFLKAAEDACGPGGCSYYPARVVLVDASGDRDAVAERIRKEVTDALALDPRS